MTPNQGESTRLLNEPKDDGNKLSKRIKVEMQEQKI